MMVQHGQEKVNFDDVSNEIFDMCRPNEPDRIEILIISHLPKKSSKFPNSAWAIRYGLL